MSFTYRVLGQLDVTRNLLRSISCRHGTMRKWQNYTSLCGLLMGKEKCGGTPAGCESVGHKLMDAMSSAQKLRGAGLTTHFQLSAHQMAHAVVRHQCGANPAGGKIHAGSSYQFRCCSPLFLHGVDASHFADCRGSRVYLDSLSRYLRRDGQVQFPNRLPRRIGTKREEFSTSGKDEAPLDMLQSIIRNQLSVRVSLLTYRMVRVGAKEKSSVPFEANVPFDFLTVLPRDLLARRAWTAWKLSASGLK